MTPSGDAQDYRGVAADVAGDSATILALWREDLNQDRNPEGKLDWFYRRNPKGTPGVFQLLHGSAREAAGVGSVGWRRMRFGTETLV